MKYIEKSNYVITISTEGNICIWALDKLQRFENEMGNIKPLKTIKSKHRLLCMTINHIGQKDDEYDLPKKNKDKKKLKRKNKISKDEKQILKRQKTH